MSRRLTQTLRRAGVHALDLLFPPVCAACATDLHGEPGDVSFCPACLEKLPLVIEPVCPACGAIVPATDGVVLDCSHCPRDRLWFDRTFALGWYDGLLRELVMRMKTEASGVLAQALTRLIVARRWAELRELTVDAVAPTPLHRVRQWQRGANPPALLSAALSGQMQWRHDPRLLRRVSNTPSQRGLTRPGRFRNVRGAMALSKRRDVRDAAVLLVDDVMTTGATSSEAARVLRRAGAAEVNVVVIARTHDAL